MTNDTNSYSAFRQAELREHLRRPAVMVPIISAFTFLLYYGTLYFGFVWDDRAQIINNPLIRSWHTLARVFVSDLWFHTSRSQVFYRPLFIVWSILNFKIFGLKPWGWHLTTILLHVAATCVVYWLARTLKLSHWTAAIAALVFGFHPVHIECAAWISAGSDPMVTVFFLLAFIGFIKGREPENPHRQAWQIGSYLLLAAALLTKEMAITFAVIVFAYEWLVATKDKPLSLASRFGRSVLSALPYGLVTIGYLVLRNLVLHRSNILDVKHSNLQMIATYPVVFYNYLRILLFPKGLTALYYVPYTEHPSLANFVIPVLVLAGAAAGVYYWRRRSQDSLISFLALWMPIGLLPVLYLRIFIPGSEVRDRYLYLPSVAFALLTAMAIELISRSRKWAKAFAIQAAVVIGLCALYATGTLLQQVYWGNDLLVFYRAYTLYPDNDVAALNLAMALNDVGAYDRSLPILQDLVRRNPDGVVPYYALTVAYLRTGQKEEARKIFQNGLRNDISLFDSEAGLTDAANVFGELGDYDSAISIYQAVLKNEPDLYSALYNGGYTYFLAGRNADAEKLLQHAMEIAPNVAPPVFYLGRVYEKEGRLSEAESYLKRAAAISPGEYGFHYWLGEVYAAEGKPDLALQAYQEELKYNPNHIKTIARLQQMGMKVPMQQ